MVAHPEEGSHFIYYSASWLNALISARSRDGCVVIHKPGIFFSSVMSLTVKAFQHEPLCFSDHNLHPSLRPEHHQEHMQNIVTCLTMIIVLSDML